MYVLILTIMHVNTDICGSCNHDGAKSYRTATSKIAKQCLENFPLIAGQRENKQKAKSVDWECSGKLIRFMKMTALRVIYIQICEKLICN